MSFSAAAHEDVKWLPASSHFGMLQFWLIANTILWPFSLLLGGMQMGLNVVLLSVAGAYWLLVGRRITKSTLRPVVAFMGFIGLSLIVAITGPCQDLLPKFFATAPLLLLLTLIGMEVGRRASIRDWLNLSKTAVWVFSIALASLLLEMAVPSLFPTKDGYRLVGKYSGLFTEPSHVAFALFPCVALMLTAKSSRIVRLGYFALIVLLVLSRSSTLLGLSAAWLIYRVASQRKLQKAILFALGGAALVAFAAVANYDILLAPTIDRVVGVAAADNTENISSLVYVQGWQDAWANIIRTKGLGLGFDMMGCHPLPNVSARNLLALGGGEELNAQDGSFIFSKVISEFGIAGLLFFVVVIGWWIRLERDIRRMAPGDERYVAKIQSALIFCFLASSFLRGTGYFSGSLLLWTTAVSGVTKWQKRHNPNPIPHARRKMLLNLPG